MSRALLASVVLGASLLTACAGGSPSGAPSTRLTLWSHTGTPGELTSLRTQVTRFEHAHPGTSVDLTVVAEGDYNDALQTATASGKLPDVLDVDGPQIASFAYQGALVPLDGLVSAAVTERMLPSLVAQGTWRGHLWAVGAFDSGLALYGDRGRLKAAGVRVPQGPDDAWTATETTRALAALAATDPDRKVLDLKLDYGTGEWLTYGFAPLVSSAGAALVDLTGHAHGTLDSPAAVQALTDLGTWAGYADPDADGKAFTERRVALSWVGHWVYADYAKALGNDLVLLPLPDLGQGSKSGQGSWAWAVGADSSQKPAAAELLTAAAATTLTNGAVPGTHAALAGSALAGAGKPVHLYADQLARTCGANPVSRACITVPRPVTPAYPTVTAAFSRAVAAVLAGGDPTAELRRAASTIDADLAANHGYAQAR